MEQKTRPFNKAAYQEYDRKNKLALIEIMEKKGFQLIGDVSTEHYKEYDVKFKHPEKGVEISFENETRPYFDRIKSSFSTIHIPKRKINTKADYYVVWNPNLEEFYLIESKIIREQSQKAMVSVNCEESHVDYKYQEDFVDIDKKLVNLYAKINNIWKSVK